jgi:Binding-protein-dependent transport system inner membrane component/Glycosyl hydrolase family 10
MRAIPGELEGAAVVDGATRLGFFWRILLPLSRPALVTVGILAFVQSWNQYLLPLLVFNDQSHFTLPLGVATFQSQYSQDTARILAFTALSMVSSLCVFVFAERRIVGGLTGASRPERRPQVTVRRLAVIGAAGLALAASGVAFAAQRHHGPPDSLRALGARIGLRIGSAIIPFDLDHPDYAKIAGEQFSTVTPGNEMKWQVVEPTHDTYDWSGGDRLVRFAASTDSSCAATCCCGTTSCRTGSPPASPTGRSPTPSSGGCCTSTSRTT